MENTIEYQSLDEIRQRQLQLKSEIRGQEKNVKHLWDTLFHSETSRGIPTPSKRVQGFISTGAGIIDGVLLGWKLYRKFNRKKK